MWSSRLLTAQPPTGLDVRLSLDADLQRTADQQLKGKKGALLLINASTGEILAISSQPGFDPNSLDATWEELNQDTSAPFVNRVTQGAYPPGTALGPFLLANRLSRGTLPTLPTELSFESLMCATTPAPALSWGSVIRSSCPAGMLALLDQLSAAQTLDLYEKLHLNVQPEIPLPVGEASALPTGLALVENPLNPKGWLISPLQMALAASTLSSGGSLPSPRLANAVNTPAQGWVILPAGTSAAALNSSGAIQAANLLARTDSPIWEAYGTGKNDTAAVSWYLAGTLPDWQGTPLTLVVVIEEDNPEAVGKIGLTVLQAALQPN
ncbi:hypothetical protein FDZ74_12170 [bacterium]|nr:MAG: hypothetical protein FDZ74_12170 [bacterium]